MIDLEKRSQKVTINLEKRGINKIPPVRVGLVLDTSGSAQPMFINGTIQDTVDRILAVAMKFDDNGELDMWHFNTAFARIKTAVKSDYNSYVEKNILKANLKLWGGTSYAPVLTDVSNFYFPEVKKGGIFGFGKKEEVTTPAICFFITDGANYDRNETEALLKSAANKNIYWHMVGVNPNVHEFSFIQEMADRYPNVGFTNLNDLNISDDQLYSDLICDEFCEWIKKF